MSLARIPLRVREEHVIHTQICGIPRFGMLPEPNPDRAPSAPAPERDLDAVSGFVAVDDSGQGVFPVDAHTAHSQDEVSTPDAIPVGGATIHNVRDQSAVGFQREQLFWLFRSDKVWQLLLERFQVLLNDVLAHVLRRPIANQTPSERTETGAEQKAHEADHKDEGIESLVLFHACFPSLFLCWAGS
jgi:hypothetical protein